MNKLIRNWIENKISHLLNKKIKVNMYQSLIKKIKKSNI